MRPEDAQRDTTPSETTSYPAEAIHHDALARYEAVLASTLDPLITIDARGIIQSASNSVETVFGWRPDELIGQNVALLMPEPHRTAHDDYLNTYRETGVTAILGRTRRFDAVHKGGRVFPVELSVSRVDVPGKAEPLFTGIIRDVTERHRADQEIRLLEQLALGIASATDLNAGLTTTLERICAATGWEYGEAWVPDPVRDRMIDTPVWHMSDLRLKHFQDGTQGRSFRRGEGLIGRVWETGDAEWLSDLTDEGLFRRAEAAAHSGLRLGVGIPILDGHEVVAVLAFFMSATREEDRRMLDLVRAAVAPLGAVFQRRRIEKELDRHRLHLEELVSERTAELEATHEQLRMADRLASIGTLAAGLGHDMNNVLLPVRMRLDAFEAANLPDELRAHLQPIRESIAYLQTLTDGLHLLARDPESPTTSGVTEIPEWWEKVSTLLTTAVPSGARFAHDLPADLPPVAVAPHRLTQAVLNLVVNASEALGDDGEIRVWAEAFGDRRFVRLAVSDNGHGMTAEIKRRAIDPFFTSKKRGLGTGLGLSLVHGVAKSGGGSVRIDSEPGAGTTVMLTLAAAEHDAPATNGPGGRTALVSVRDGRLASLTESCLVGSGVTVEREAGCIEPGSVDIWVTDPDPEALPAVKAMLEIPERQVIVLGNLPPQWTLQGIVAVDRPDDFELLRLRIGEALVSTPRRSS